MHDEFLTWCDQRTGECMAQQRVLSADGRGDEASFMQIRANVYGVFRSVYTALKGDLPAVQERLMSIPATWEKSLHLAQTHDDDAKAHIERIKLETAAAIRHYLTHLEAKNHD